MSKLTELEQSADREARHGHRELVERLEARVDELERIALDWEEAAREESNRAEHAVDEQRTAWDDAIRAAAKACSDLQDKADALNEEYGEKRLPAVCLEPDGHDCAEAIRTLLRKGGSDDQ